MKTDKNGCSTTQSGSEQYEHFWRKGRPLVQYDYRTANGGLFSTVAPTLDIARARRDQWKEAIERPNPELK